VTREPLSIILDMDGLMLDTEPISLRAWRAAALDLGYVLDDQICDAMIGRPAGANIEQLREHFGDAFPGEALLVSAGERYRALLGDGIPHKAGLLDFLRFLEARHLPRAVATSTATGLAREKLERAGVLGYFEVVVGGDMVARGKPAPDIFLAAASRIGANPAGCIVLEDSGPGVFGAAAAGMRPVLIPDGREPSAEVRAAAFAVVGSLTDAGRLIHDLLGPIPAGGHSPTP
jgi:HAD superfamily hydrolase (TIGR01509 family)